jgi:hypothetical protein
MIGIKDAEACIRAFEESGKLAHADTSSSLRPRVGEGRAIARANRSLSNMVNSFKIHFSLGRTPVVARTFPRTRALQGL